MNLNIILVGSSPLPCYIQAAYMLGERENLDKGSLTEREVIPKPDKILLVATANNKNNKQGTNKYAENIVTVLENEGLLDNAENSTEIIQLDDGRDAKSILDTIRGKIKEINEKETIDHIIINNTGGTKTMSTYATLAVHCLPGYKRIAVTEVYVDPITNKLRCYFKKKGQSFPDEMKSYPEEVGKDLRNYVKTSKEELCRFHYGMGCTINENKNNIREYKKLDEKYKQKLLRVADNILRDEDSRDTYEVIFKYIKNELSQEKENKKNKINNISRVKCEKCIKALQEICKSDKNDLEKCKECEKYILDKQGNLLAEKEQNVCFGCMEYFKEGNKFDEKKLPRCPGIWRFSNGNNWWKQFKSANTNEWKNWTPYAVETFRSYCIENREIGDLLEISEQTDEDEIRWVLETFGDGYWLEAYCYEKIQAVIAELDEEKQKMIETAWSFEVIPENGKDENKFEVDILVVYGYELTLFSVTMAGNENLDTTKGKWFEAVYRVEQIAGEHGQAKVINFLTENQDEFRKNLASFGNTMEEQVLDYKTLSEQGSFEKSIRKLFK